VQKELNIPDNFRVVTEDDGSGISQYVLVAIIEDGERIGTIMVLGSSQQWSREVCLCMIIVAVKSIG